MKELKYPFEMTNRSKLAFYKESGEPWTRNELVLIKTYTRGYWDSDNLSGNYIGYTIYDDGSGYSFPWTNQDTQKINQCTKIDFETHEDFQNIIVTNDSTKPLAIYLGEGEWTEERIQKLGEVLGEPIDASNHPAEYVVHIIDGYIFSDLPLAPSGIYNLTMYEFLVEAGSVPVTQPTTPHLPPKVLPSLQELKDNVLDYGYIHTETFTYKMVEYLARTLGVNMHLDKTSWTNHYRTLTPLAKFGVINRTNPEGSYLVQVRDTRTIITLEEFKQIAHTDNLPSHKIYTSGEFKQIAHTDNLPSHKIYTPEELKDVQKLAFYKASEEPWTQEEYVEVNELVGVSYRESQCTQHKYMFKSMTGTRIVDTYDTQPTQEQLKDFTVICYEHQFNKNNVVLLRNKGNIMRKLDPTRNDYTFVASRTGRAWTVTEARTVRKFFGIDSYSSPTTNRKYIYVRGLRYALHSGQTPPPATNELIYYEDVNWETGEIMEPPITLEDIRSNSKGYSVKHTDGFTYEMVQLVSEAFDVPIYKNRDKVSWEHNYGSTKKGSWCFVTNGHASGIGLGVDTDTVTVTIQYSELVSLMANKWYIKSPGATKASKVPKKKMIGFLDKVKEPTHKQVYNALRRFAKGDIYLLAGLLRDYNDSGFKQIQANIQNSLNEPIIYSHEYTPLDRDTVNLVEDYYKMPFTVLEVVMEHLDVRLTVEVFKTDGMDAHNVWSIYSRNYKPNGITMELLSSKIDRLELTYTSNRQIIVVDVVREAVIKYLNDNKLATWDKEIIKVEL